MKRKNSKIKAAIVTAVFLSIFAAAEAVTAQENDFVQPALTARVKAVIQYDGYEFKDLNGNGQVDPYEDWRLSASARAQDLLERMSSRQKAAQMLHPTLEGRKNSWFTDANIGFGQVYDNYYDSPVDVAHRANEIQELSEQSPLGIPVILSMEIQTGASYVRGAVCFPNQTAQGAAWSASLTEAVYGDMREELMAVGVRMAFAPEAQLITDPKQEQNQERFSEDAQVVSDLSSAAVRGLQNGNTISEKSVIAAVKYYPLWLTEVSDGEASSDGESTDPADKGLEGLRAAAAQGAAAVMVSGAVPVSDEAESEPSSGEPSGPVISGLLQKELGFDGLILSGRDADYLSAAQAGISVLTGAGVRYIDQLTQELTEEMLSEACLKILTVKFEMGLFENPYVDETASLRTVGNEQHTQTALEMASASLTLIKYDAVPALDDEEQIIIAGAPAGDLSALCGSRSFSQEEGDTILEAFRKKNGNIRYIEEAADVTADMAGKTAVVVMEEENSKADTDPPGLPGEQIRLLQALKNAGANTIAVVLMSRPCILTPVCEEADAVLLSWRPGTACGAQAIVKALYGESAITGTLPFQLPRPSDQTAGQQDDQPGDIEDPLYGCRYGITVERFGK